MKSKHQPNSKQKSAILSPITYIKTKTKDLPFGNCYSSYDKDDTSSVSGLETVLVSRIMPSGKLVVGMYLIDRYCLGVKNTVFRFAMTTTEFQEFIEMVQEQERRDFFEISPSMAANLVFGALDYAEQLGFRPEKDFAITKYIIDEDLITEDIEDIEFGQNGKPTFIQGPYDNVKTILATLNKNVGEGNYEYVMMLSENDEFELLEGDFDDAEVVEEKK
jgi:hypothetical protein